MYTNIPALSAADLIITRKGEAVVKPRWCGDRIPVFKDSLDENSIDELLISLGAVNPQNTNIVTVNKIVFVLFTSTYHITIIFITTYSIIILFRLAICFSFRITITIKMYFLIILKS
jgi:hypothetical protein